MRRQIVEVDTRLRLALLAQPVAQATVVIEYPAVRLGRSLVVATGLSNVWMRKEAQGPVDLRVVIDGAADATFTTRNDDGWALHRLDTSARAGQIAAQASRTRQTVQRSACSERYPGDPLANLWRTRSQPRSTESVMRW